VRDAVEQLGRGESLAVVKSLRGLFALHGGCVDG